MILSTPIQVARFIETEEMIFVRIVGEPGVTGATWNEKSICYDIVADDSKTCAKKFTDFCSEHEGQQYTAQLKRATGTNNKTATYQSFHTGSTEQVMNGDASLVPTVDPNLSKPGFTYEQMNQMVSQQLQGLETRLQNAFELKSATDKLTIAEAEVIKLGEVPNRMVNAGSKIIDRWLTNSPVAKGLFGDLNVGAEENHVQAALNGVEWDKVPKETMDQFNEAINVLAEKLSLESMIKLSKKLTDENVKFIQNFVNS